MVLASLSFFRTIRVMTFIIWSNFNKTILTFIIAKIKFKEGKLSFPVRRILYIPRLI